jgi:hypothetical protein
MIDYETDVVSSLRDVLNMDKKENDDISDNNSNESDSNVKF